MTELAQSETSPVKGAEQPRQPDAAVTAPTSPDQDHNETVSKIVPHLAAAGHPASVETVKASQSFQPSSALQKIGMAPSEGEISPEDLGRLVGDLTKPEEERGEVSGKGKHGVDIKLGRQHRQGGSIRGKVVSLLDKLGLNRKAA